MNLAIKNKLKAIDFKMYIKYDAISLLALFVVQVFIGIFMSFSKTTDGTIGQTEMYLHSIPILFMGMIGSPILEEFIFRKYLWKKVISKRVKNIFLSALITSLLFGMAHGFSNTIPLTATGLIFCFLYHKTGSIFNNMFLHSIYNITLLLLYIAFL